MTHGTELRGGTPDIIIIGAGLAGLACATYLARHQRSFLLLEASDRVGGLVRTDVEEGFLLDRGFQVFLTSYPEAKALLDYKALKLSAFRNGALVRVQDGFYSIADPWRAPLEAIKSLITPLATLADKYKLARMRTRILTEPLEQILSPFEEMTTADYLAKEGFSDLFFHRFLCPFLGGVFLDPKLQTSSRVFEFVFRMFATGEAALPAGGMEAIPRQLAEKLPPGSVQTQSPVQSIQPLPNGQVSLTLASGQTLTAKAVVVAVSAPGAARLLPELVVPQYQGVSCLYFAAEIPPEKEPVLILNGEGTGLINNVSVLSQVAPTYAPAGQALVSVSVLQCPEDPECLLSPVRQQLVEWFGEAVHQWRHLRTDVIREAVPFIPPGEAGRSLTQSVRHAPGVYLCGAYLEVPSINGALVSGRRAAEAVLADCPLEAFSAR